MHIPATPGIRSSQVSTNNQGFSSKIAAVRSFARNTASSLMNSNLQREVGELPAILWPGETAEMMTPGTYDAGFTTGGISGLLVATDRRVIFLKKAGFGSVSAVDFAYDKISTLESKEGVVFGEIILNLSGQEVKIEFVPVKELRPFADLVRNKVLAAHGGDLEPHPVALSSVADELAKFANLREQGVISDEEFNAQKSRLLR